MQFRSLSPEEVADFRNWADWNHRAGDPINVELWHPVVVKRCREIDARDGAPEDEDGKRRDCSSEFSR